MKKKDFFQYIKQGIPQQLPFKKSYDQSKNHAPFKKLKLSKDEKILALKNALRYFPKNQHHTLIKEFKLELEKYGKIYMYRFKPAYQLKARNINDFPHK